jgi:hypothetical protein
MIVVPDRQMQSRSRPIISLSGPGARSVVLGLASPPTRSVESDWPKWLMSFEHASKSVAHAGHRRSRRSD